ATLEHELRAREPELELAVEERRGASGSDMAERLRRIQPRHAQQPGRGDPLRGRVHPAFQGTDGAIAALGIHSHAMTAVADGVREVAEAEAEVAVEIGGGDDAVV